MLNPKDRYNVFPLREPCLSAGVSSHIRIVTTFASSTLQDMYEIAHRLGSVYAIVSKTTNRHIPHTRVYLKY